jgi:hypothetical protein
MSESIISGRPSITANNGDNINRLPETSPDPLDPFEPANLRLDPEYLKTGGVKKLLTTVPVRKPNKQDFIRVHSDPEYRLCGVGMIELQEEREIYLVTPGYVRQLEPQTFSFCNLYLAINRQKVVFLWPCEIAGDRGPCKSMAHFGTGGRGESDGSMDQGRGEHEFGAYEFFVAENPLSDPEWPSVSLRDLLQIAFKGHVIDGRDHPVMQRLRGAI